jgi:hypothetical protein
MGNGGITNTSEMTVDYESRDKKTWQTKNYNEPHGEKGREVNRG